MTRILLLASLLLALAVPVAAADAPIVGTRFSIASGWMGIATASDSTNFLVALESDKTADKVAAQLISSSGAKIGSTIALGTDGQSCCAAGAAFDGINYLVTWEHDQGIKNYVSAPYQVYGQFISASGAKVGQAFAISTAGIYFDGMNMLAYGGGKYLVTYRRLIDPTQGGASTNSYVAGRIITPDGFMGSEFRISTGYGESSNVTFDGTNFFVVWQQSVPSPAVRGRFVSTTGTVGQEVVISANPAIASSAVVDFDGSNYAVGWSQSIGPSGGAYVQLISPGGALVGGVITLDGNGQSGKWVTAISFDGSNHLAAWTDGKNDANGNNACDSGEGTCWDVYGRYFGKDGALASSIFVIDTDAGNQMSSVYCAGGKCLASVSSGFTMGSGGPSQVGEAYGAFLTFQASDTLPPSVPTGVSATAISTTQISLSWTASTDNVGVTGYKVYRNYQLVGSPTSTSFGDTGLTAATAYSYSVAACDAASNCSAQSSEISATAQSGGATLNLISGWNLVGNSTETPIAVATTFNDSAKVASVWKWVATNSKWAIYLPSMSGTELSSYASSNGYTVLSSIAGGDGFWVKANSAFTAQLPGSTTVASSSFQSLSSGWHLISTGTTETPSSFNTNLSPTPPTAGVVPLNITSLWAWDSAQSKWHFYSPNLEAQGGSALSDYINSKGYLNFTTANKNLGQGVGFWVNKP